MKSNHTKAVLLSISMITEFLVQVRTFQKIPFLNILAQQFIEKLGDSKEKLRQISLIALVELFSTVKDQEFQSKLESMIVSRGFGSKIANARECSILFVIHVYEQCQTSLKPYVPSIVQLLEDQNETVRQSAKKAIVDLYQSSQNPALYSDILKEMSKQNIRSSIVEGITSQLGVVGVKEGLDKQEGVMASEGDAGKEKETGDSLTPMQFNSEADLEREMNGLINVFQGKETEQNWSDREAALQRFRSILRGNGIHYNKFVSLLKPMIEQIVICLGSLRSALCLLATTVIQDMSNFIAPQLEPFVEIMIAALIKTNSSSKKLIANAALSTSKGILMNVSFQPKVLVLFLNALNEKSPSVRQGSSECVRLLMELVSLDSDAKGLVERSMMLEAIHKGLKRALTDSDGTVRSFGREAYYFFAIGWPERANVLFGELDLAGQKAISKSTSPPASAFKTPSKKKIVSAPVTPVPVRGTPSKPDALVQEKDVDLLLKSLRNKELEGLVGVLSYTQENMGIIPTDVSSRIQSTILGLLKETCPEAFLEGLVHSQTALLLDESGILSLEELLIPYLKIYFATCSDTIREQVEQFLYTFKASRNLEQVLLTLIDTVSSISTMSFKKKSKEMKQAEEATRMYVLEWIHTLLESFDTNELDLSAFFQDGNVRLFLNKLVPLSLQFQDSKDICGKVFKIVYEIASGAFMNVLETFDLDNAYFVKQLVGIMDTEDLSLEEMEEMDQEFGRVGQASKSLEDIAVATEDAVMEVEEKRIGQGPIDDENNTIGALFTERDTSREVSRIAESVEDVLNESLPNDFEEPSILVSDPEPLERRASVLPDITIREGVSGMVGTREQVEPATPMSGLRNYLEQVITPKRPGAQNGYDPQDLTPKQVRFNHPTDELKELTDLLNQAKELDQVYNRLLQLSRRYPCNALDKSGFFYWDANFVGLLKAILSNADESFTNDIQANSLVLLKILIMNQSELISAHEKEIFLTLCISRSDGSPEISGAAEGALMALIGISDPKETAVKLISLLQEWDLDDPKSIAYRTRHTQHQYRPVPIATCFYAIENTIRRVNPAETDLTWLSESVFPVLHRELANVNVTVRKAAYDCLVQCSIAFNTQFWQLATEFLSVPQVKLINAMQRKRESGHTIF